MTELVEKKLKEKQDNLLQIYEGLKNLQKLPLDKLEQNIEVHEILQNDIEDFKIFLKLG